MVKVYETHFGSMDNFNAFNDARKEEQRNELSAMVPPPSRFSPPLAGYLLQRTVEGRRVEGPTLSALRQGQETIFETRGRLSEGRGNVSDDIQRTGHGSSRRTATAREIAQNFTSSEKSPFVGGMFSAVAAMQTRAGNCGEHANLATMLHSKRLQAGQEVHSVHSTGVDHAWSELRTGSQARPNDVIIDAWGKGSAVLREDSAFARSSVKSSFGIDHTNASASTARFDNFASKVAGHQPTQAKMARLLDEKNRSGFEFSKKSVFAPTPVASDSFRSRTAGMLDNLVQRQTMNSAFNTTLQDLKLTRAANPKEVRQVEKAVLARKDVSKQIMAVGAARDAGANVAKAAGFANRYFSKAPQRQS